ncbi:MAG TPA: response regulator transcription factor [Clostridiaceae bacterium]|nr:response regulator transcription factor [Clostridiaceae bacterium]
MTRILLVEDDDNIINNLSVFLKNEGFDVDVATGQKAAMDKLSNSSYDLLLLDISLKDGNGFSVCSAVKSNFNIPVIFLTASDDEYSVVAGFDLGADDYIGKPFRPRELISRIKNVLRRSNKFGSTIEYKGITIDTEKGIAMKNGRDLFLSALEYRLLLVFFYNKGAVLSRNKLLEEIWNIAGEFVNDNTLTVYIKRLRDKIEDDPQNPSIIRTVRGLGYKVGD